MAVSFENQKNFKISSIPFLSKPRIILLDQWVTLDTHID